MGERTDDLGQPNDEYTSDYDRSQEIAGRNQERMRENLSSTSSLDDDALAVSGVTRTDYIVEEGGAPGRTSASDSSMDTMDASADASRDDINESTTEMRNDIQDTRARMGSTIDAIQDKLSPQRLMDQAKQAAHDATIGKAGEMASNVADTARETGSTLMDTIRSNPVPVALTAVGLGWLIFSVRRDAADRRDRQYWNARRYSRSGSSGGRYPGGYPGMYAPNEQQSEQSRVGQMTDRVQDTAQKVGDQVQQAAGTVADKAGDMADYAQWQAQRTRGWLEQTWNDNPLLVAGAALALGTVVGLAVPETQMENQMMGEARDDLVQKAQGVAQQTVQKAQNAATGATNKIANQQSTADSQQTMPGRRQPTSH